MIMKPFYQKEEEEVMIIQPYNELIIGKCLSVTWPYNQDVLIQYYDLTSCQYSSIIANDHPITKSEHYLFTRRTNHLTFVKCVKQLEPILI